MARKVNPEAVERDRKRKRINVPLSARDSVTVVKISANRGFPNSKVVAYMIGRGIEAEWAGRMALNRPIWPRSPGSPRYVQAALSPSAFEDLIDVAESLFEPLNNAASALFQIGLAEYLAERES